MKCIFTLFLLLPGLVLSQNNTSDSLNQYLADRIQADSTPGISIAVIDESGDVTFFSLGYTNLDKTQQPDKHTIYEIGSITKTFTASILQVLLAQNGLNLETPVNELIKGHVQIHAYEDIEITVGHLLNHHSALPRLPGNMDFEDPGDPYFFYTNELMYAYLDELSLTRKPGSEFEYSNLAYMLAGQIAELLSDSEMDELYKRFITGPLEMNSTSRILADSSRFAQPTMAGQPVQPWNFDGVKGLGELRSTASDLSKYLKMMAGHIGHPYHNYFSRGFSDLMPLSENVYMGHGWFVRVVENDTLVYHGGGTGGFRTFAGFSSVTDRGAVVLANSGSDVQDIGLHLINAEFELNPLKEFITIDEAHLDKLAGLYTSEVLPRFEVYHENGQLFGQMTGQIALPMMPISETEFVNESVGATVTFTIEGDKATALTLTQMGQSFPFIRDDEATEPEVMQKSEEELEAYTGVYSGSGFQLTITRSKNQLSARLTGQPAVEIYPSAQDIFFYKVVPAELHFSRNEDGRITKATLHQAGMELIFERGE